MSGTGDPPRDQSKSDFMAAEQIKKVLEGREKAEQERIVRWVTESLGLAGTLGGAGGPVTLTSPPQSTPPAPPAGPQGHPASPRARASTIKAFVDEKQPKSDIQFATVVAYYYRFEAPETDRKEAITQKDLQEAARLARRDRFGKPYMPLSNAVSQGYLDRAERGSFKVNAVGENLVAMTLPGTRGESGRPRQGSKSKRRPGQQAKKRGKKQKAS